jgi:hypothetical protein
MQFRQRRSAKSIGEHCDCLIGQIAIVVLHSINVRAARSQLSALLEGLDWRLVHEARQHQTLA